MSLSRFKLIFSAVFLSSLGLSNTGCSDGGNPLVSTYGVVGTSYCDEVNQIFDDSLKHHISKTENDRDEVYAESIRQTVFQVRKRAPSKVTAARVADFLETFGVDGPADADRLKDCTDLLAIQDLMDQAGIYSSSDSDPEKRNQDVFRLFLRSFASNLDYYSGYFSPSQDESFGYGFGLNLDTRIPHWYKTNEDSLEVYATDFPDHPLKVHDQILKVSTASENWRDNSEIGLESVRSILEDLGESGLVSRFSSAQGPYIKVLVKRANSGREEVLRLSRRESSRLPLVSVEILDGSILYTRLMEFDPGAGPELLRKLKAARSELQSKASGASSSPTIILDLRWNPGGDLRELQEILGYFLPSGDYGRVKKRNGAEIQQDVLSVSGTSEFKSEPMVVLVNHGSASASDILTQVLKESGRAFVIGERTFGKGIGQRIYQLGSKSHIGGAFKITSLQFYGPSGQSIQIAGNSVHLEVRDSRIENLKDLCGRSCVLRMDEVTEKTGWDVPPQGPGLAPISSFSADLEKTNYSSARIAAAQTSIRSLTILPKDIVLETALRIIRQADI